jgi:hypothetical protein
MLVNSFISGMIRALMWNRDWRREFSPHIFVGHHFLSYVESLMVCYLRQVDSHADTLLNASKQGLYYPDPAMLSVAEFWDQSSSDTA